MYSYMIYFDFGISVNVLFVR